MLQLAYNRTKRTERTIGAVPTEYGCWFRVWSPHLQRVELHVVSPRELLVPMELSSSGYHEVFLRDVSAGTRYFYRLDGVKELPDPASRSQPEGVHGPSEVIESGNASTIRRNWSGIPIESFIIYEIHVGTFTTEGTFSSAISQLDRVADLGVTAIELMPVAQFPGERNWGYDGAYPFAVQNSYGGPAGLRAFVDACHERGIAVILDVVYNHLGPEGNYLAQFGPYFTDKFKTPWGTAVNFDDEYSDEVRRYFIDNALYWITDFQIDALRLDAVHAILDHSAFHILEELSDTVHRRGTELNRRVYLIGESALNDTRLIRSSELGGYNIDAQWNDDFHHSLHTLLTGERQGYYEDFGHFQHMAQAFAEGFVYSGRYSPSRHRRHGNSSRTIPPQKLVVYSKNHDQVGNRVNGERLSELVPFEALKLASAAVLLSPFIPLIFMGDEYGELAPFQYFISHSEPSLIEAVRLGRRKEFAKFEWAADPADPQHENTFLRSKINTELRHHGRHRALYDFTRELIRLRQTVPALGVLSKEKMDVIGFEDDCTLVVRRWDDGNEVVSIFNFNDKSVVVPERALPARFLKLLDSDDQQWMGRGSNISAVINNGQTSQVELKPAAVVVVEIVPTGRTGIRSGA